MTSQTSQPDISKKSANGHTATSLNLAKMTMKLVDDELARRDIGAFIARLWPWWETARHHELLFDFANRLVNRPSQFLAISLPPRHSKSQIFSIALPLFFLGRHPHKSVIHISHTLSLSQEFSFHVRDVVRDGITYRRMFPATRLHREKRRLDNWKTTRGGSWRSLGVGGGVTGLGADLIILDDVVKEGDERSPARLKEIWDWYASAARTRLMPGGSIAVVMTRWSEDDLVGHLERVPGGDPWEFIRLPGLAVEGDVLHREPGEALWPERFSEDYLRGMRALNEPYFDALYQQDPRAAVAHPFEVTYFQKVGTVFRPDGRAFWAVDLAITESETADYTAWARFHRSGENLFVSRPGRVREEWPDVKNRLRSILSRFPGDTLVFEHRLHEIMAVQELRKEFPGRVRSVKVKGDKMARASAAAAVAESGRIKMVECVEGERDFRQEMIDECVAFPGEHDDFVDVLSLGVHHAQVGRLDVLTQPRFERGVRLREREYDMIGRMT